jgi:hypothetical protein
MIPADREWFSQPPASGEAVEAMRRLENVELPLAYLQLLAFSNGGEGPLPVQPWNFCLDPAEVASQNWREQTFAEFFPGFFVFGSNGAGELFAFDLRVANPWPVVALDSANCDLRDTVLSVAKNFDAFMGVLGQKRHA